MVAQFRPPIKQISETALPPQNVELEEAILGCILLDPNAYPRLLQLPKQLSPEAFYLSHHKTIFKAIQALANKGQPTDLMTVCSYLSDKKKLDEVGGASSLAQLLDRTVTAVNIDRYAERLIDKHIRRELIGVAQDITNLSFNTCNPLEYVCNTVKKLVEPLIDPILANKSTEEYEYSCVVSKVKEIMLYEHKPGLRYFKLDRLAKEVGSSVNKLENLFFMSMLEDQYEPLLSFKEMMVKYGKDTQKWVIQGLLPRGSLTELYALPGDGKTLLSYDLICSALIGEPWNGFPVANQKLKAVIIQTDEAPQATLLTLRDRLEGRNLEVYFKTCWTIEQLFQLKLELEEIQPDILMIDSLTSINRNTTKSENDSDYARNIYALRQMCGDMGMAGILIHHSNKLGDSRGSTGIPGAVDQVINLQRHPEVRDNSDPRRHLEIKKSRFRLPMTYALELKEDKTWKLTGRVGASLKFEGTANNRIVEFLGLNRGTLYTNQELGEILTLSENTIRVATGGLQSERLIECCRGQGKAKFYYIPDDTLPNGYQLQAKNRSSDAIASLSDREKIAEAITPESSPPETIERIDHETAKNDLDFSENPEKKCDLTIDSPETSVPPESGSDPSSDPEAIASPETPAPSKSECDRGVDRSRSPRSLPAIGATVGIFEEGEYVLIQVTGHHEDVVVGYAEDNRRFEVLVDLCCEPVIRDRAGVQLKVGDKVHYVGDDQRLAKVSKSETLTIKSFRYGWVRAGGKNWGSRLTNHPAHEFEKARRS